MQTNFKKTITSLEKHSFTYHFNRIYTVNGIRYHVSFRGPFYVSHYFMMEGKGDGWYFTDITELPEWLVAMERKFETAIQENINGSQEKTI